MIDPAGVTEIERIDDLDEDTLDQIVISEERELLDDRVEIASTEVIDKEDVAACIDLAMDGKNIGVE